MFLKLHSIRGEEFWVNLSNVLYFTSTPKGTQLVFVDDRTEYVCETVDQIGAHQIFTKFV